MYNKINSQLLKMIVFIIAIVLIIANLSIINFSTIVHANNNSDNSNEKTIIKVGYCEDYAMIKSPMIEGYEGYGWEYLQKIAKYMDGNYEFEFVVGSWSEGLQRLEAGEIDLLGPANYSEERAEKFVYTTETFGMESAILTSLDPEYLSNSSYMKLQNGIVGVVKGDVTIGFLYDYLERNNITTTVVETETSDFSYELSQQRFDYFLTGSMQMENELNIVLNLGSNPVYLIGNENSRNIVEEIDIAINKVRESEYMLVEQLYFKYFNYDTSRNQYISNDEYDLLQSQEVYNVGISNIYENSNAKISFEVANIPVDIINFIANKANINVNLIEVTKDTTQEELDKLDFYFPVDGYEYSYNQKQSTSYMKTPLTIIEKSVQGLTSHGMLGMPSYYGFGYESSKYLLPDQGFDFYDNIDNLLEDFKNGKLSKMILTEATYRMLYQEISKYEHITTTTEYSVGPKIVFSDNFSDEKIAVINKVISYISNENIEESILKNITLISELERTKLLKNYSYILIAVLIFSGICILINRKIKDKQIKNIETYDTLTGLYSQNKFNELASELLAKNPTKDYSMLTLDVDNFKYINEIYGYEIGSNILIHVANSIKKTVGEDAVFTRVSGDNFILIIETNLKHLDEICALTTRPSLLLNRISNLIDKEYVLTFSIGCYNITDKSIAINYMIDSCNIARALSKGKVGTSLNIFVEEMRELEAVKNNIEANMHTALKDGEFVVYYQPKFDIESTSIVGAEALIRWLKDDKLIPPNDFIPLFEKNGFIEQIDYYVLDETCRFIYQNKDIVMPQISVNLSGITIMKKDLINKIVSITQKYNINPASLDLEITESAFVDHFELAVNKIDKLRELGFTISMDDFGTGISSLGRLKEISIDVLKIDREFIIQSLEHEKTRTIIKNIINMAKDLNLKTIAEGVETKEQLDFLHEVGCDVGQGYFVAKPLPANEFITLLKNN